MFFRNRHREKGEDLNQKVEKFRRRWRERREDSEFDRSSRSRDNGASRKAYDSSFVYYEEG